MKKKIKKALKNAEREAENASMNGYGFLEAYYYGKTDAYKEVLKQIKGKEHGNTL